MLTVNLGCPEFCEGWICVDLHPHDERVLESDAIWYLWGHTIKKDIDCIKALNLIEHLPDVGFFFKAAHDALKMGGTLIIRTDNAEWLPFYVPIIHRLGWAAHCSDKYSPAIMNETQHYGVFTKLHLSHYAKEYGFEVIAIKRDWRTAGARLWARFRKVQE